MASKRDVRDRLHIFPPSDQWRTREAYKPHQGGGGAKKPSPPSIGRPKHGEMLKDALKDAAALAARRRDASALASAAATPGMYLEFESFPGIDLALKSMEARRAKDAQRHIELVAVTEHIKGEAESAVRTQRAVVFVPDGEVKHFINQLEKYVDTTPKEPRARRNEDIYDRIASVRLAVLRALWTDSAEAFPEGEDDTIWWEVWLRRTDGKELDRLREYCNKVNVKLSPQRLLFSNHIVTLIFASRRALAGALDVMGDIAELQRAKETASFFMNEKPSDQAQWAADLTRRTTPPGPDAPSVCVLDTGVTAGHPLLAHALAPSDCHAYDPNWGVHDHDGHGTQMAGLALYGDLVPLLAGTASVNLHHCLESVKILPPTGQNEPSLFGAVTVEATSRPEIQAPARRRVFSMAITTDGRDRGQPTSWSAAIDALASGRSFDPINGELTYLDDQEDAFPRLFAISAGNVAGINLNRDHISRSDVEPVQDPAQAWNALTIGAFTEKIFITDPSWNGSSPLAPSGDLSPWSTTSVAFQPAWPIKPEVLFEGGNVVIDNKGMLDFPCDDLCLLTTYYKPNQKQLDVTWATSAATAQGARFCALVRAEYPHLWPETIRALVVHSAEWTPQMRSHLPQGSQKNNKTARFQLLRRYGFGVPNLDRARRSGARAVTIISQDVIQPFKDGKMREIHFHRLPWPREVLSALGSAEVRLRVTLSYFIEPNPGRRGWQTRHRYQSHGLRFEVKGPTESPEDFRKRLNQGALEDEENRPSSGADNDGWYFGARARNRGSIHSDTFTASAADLAERGLIAIFPVTGWWKEIPKRDRSALGARYALVVSLETDAIDADIWTPIAAQVGVATKIET